jgi:hypothetical protein
MASDIQPLPEPEQHLVRKYDALTRRVALPLFYGPIAGLILAAWRVGTEPAILPYTLIVPAYAVSTLLILPCWLGWRKWCFDRMFPCPWCSGRLRADRRIGREPTTTWLICSGCGVTWNSGGGHYDNRHPNDHNG